ncbi:glycosyltransferase [Microbacterium binotii]|uniref:Glycosyltransferase 2-like domain-containing protein n=1 Tax=Microbacterium binotii TaxID=462710 RepID=A0ABN3P5H3_9MICO
MKSDVAVVITAHAEGRILVPTLRSVAAASARARESGLRVEVVIVLDRADAETVRVVDGHAETALAEYAAVRRIVVDNGDLGLSRNDGIAAADAPLVTVLDGDNLISREWLVAGARTIAENGAGSIAHPELIVSFGTRRTMWRLGASTDADFRPELLAVVNPWDACVMAPREVFEQVPYLRLPPGEGHGPEDWSWNVETLERGMRHVVVAQSVMFYRVRGGSLLAAHGDNLLPRLDYLGSGERAAEVVRRFGSEPEAPVPSARDTFRRVVPHPVRAIAADVLRGARSGLRRARRRDDLPVRAIDPWLDEAWREANQLEPEVPFPRPEALGRYDRWGHPWAPWDAERALAYWRMLDAIGSDVDFLFVAPWVRTGGGDRVLLQYIAAVRRLDPEANVVLLTTEPEPSTRLSDVPAGVRVVEMRHQLSRFVDREWMVGRLLPQLLVQAPPRTMHVFNSTVGFDVIERFGRVLSRRIAIFVSSFVLDRTPDGERTSVLFYRHPRFLEPIQAVLVDSDAFAATMEQELGYPREKFHVRRQIVAQMPHMRPRHTGPFDAEHPLRVLWAGRFDLQKRLDVLADVAEEAVRRGVPVRFDFYGEAVMGDPRIDEHLDRLAAAGAVRHGAYQDIAHLSLDQYGAFILTSEWEGVPNTLLEVMSAAMPAVAPLVGGVPEVLDESTGYPVESFDDPAAYVDALQSIVEDFPVALARAERARDLVHSTFSVTAFDEGLAALPAYLAGLDENIVPIDTVEAGMSAVRFVADADTTAFLRSDADRVYVFSGSGGYANFGDILQPKNALHLWATEAPDRPTVIFFHVGSARTPEHVDALRSAYRCRHIVFFARPDDDVPAWLSDATAQPVPGGDVHVVGGGFLNAEWGPGYLAVIDEIVERFDGRDVLFSGMQIDDFILPFLVDFAERRRVVSFGTRDERSFERARGALGELAVRSFDDLYEAIAAWAPPHAPRERRPGPFRLGLHINASGYVGGDEVVEYIGRLLAEVLDRHPDAELTLLQAYDDKRPEVMDTLASLRLFDDEFPFEKFETVDLARVALSWDPDGPAPQAIAELELDAAITCSYHTTMLLHTVGVPAYLIRLNAYYAQKADIFALPERFADFLADPAAYVKTFPGEIEWRGEWRERFRSWATGDVRAFEALR